MAGTGTLTTKIRNYLPGVRQQPPHKTFEPQLPQLQNVRYDEDGFEIDETEPDLGVRGDRPARPTYEDGLIREPGYEGDQIQILNDIAADESFPAFVEYIEKHSRLGNLAKARILVRGAAFLSKNHVFSNIVDIRDYLMATDDFAYAALLEKADFTCYDMNADYFEANAILEGNYNIRLRRSRNALNLLQINTQRQESIYPTQSQHEQQRLRNKIPFIGSYL